MVARINSGRSIANALNYNEQKLKLGKAECVHAENFLKDTEKLNFYDKLRHFERLTSLNERTTTNTLHVSLNFDPSEKLSNDKLNEIAKEYMQKIGFEKQPYLVYRHYDAGHPHIHIVSTNIQDDGKRISLHNLGKNQSEKARKEIEKEFGLVQAESKKMSEALKLQQVNAQKLSYGKYETKRALTNVLAAVVNQYKFTSLAELNAVLKLYNVTADRGKEDSRLYNYRGLQYRVLDENGSKTGVPIKASAFYFKPTLDYLEKKFAENQSLRQQHKQRLKATIDWTLLKKNLSMSDLTKALEKERISTVLRQNKEGLIYGITFVDHQTKCVFNGSDLGKQYSAAALLERCEQKNMLLEKQAEELQQKLPHSISPEIKPSQANEWSDEKSFQKNTPNITEEIMKPIETNDYLPFDLKQTRRKRKRQSQSNYLK